MGHTSAALADVDGTAPICDNRRPCLLPFACC